MNTLIAVQQFFGGNIIGLLERIAIVCIIVWGIWQLVLWAGWTISRPIQIVAICLISILIIIWMFQIFAQLV